MNGEASEKVRICAGSGKKVNRKHDDRRYGVISLLSITLARMSTTAVSTVILLSPPPETKVGGYTGEREGE